MNEYEQLSVGFSVCKHIKDLGPFRVSSTVRYHDQQTRAQEKHPLG